LLKSGDEVLGKVTNAALRIGIGERGNINGDFNCLHGLIITGFGGEGKLGLISLWRGVGLG